MISCLLRIYTAIIIDSCPCDIDLSKTDISNLMRRRSPLRTDNIASLAYGMVFSRLDSFQNRHITPKRCVFSWGGEIWAQNLDRKTASSRFATKAIVKMEKIRRFHRNQCEKLVEEV